MEFKMNRILKTIVCGYERGGTTLINEILRSHPRMDSGFECGFLLAPSPRDYLKAGYRDFNGSLIKNGWGITQEELEDYICDTDSWETVYRRLREKSRVVENKSVMLFDKTPKYLERLDQVMGRIPSIPCIVIAKEAKGVIWSWIKRSDSSIDAAIRDEQLKAYANRYISYYKGFERALPLFSDRILLVHYHKLCAHPVREVKRIFKFLKMPFSRNVMQFQSNYGVHGSKISKEYMNEHERHLPKQTLARIDELTEKADWGFDEPNQAGGFGIAGRRMASKFRGLFRQTGVGSRQ